MKIGNVYVCSRKNCGDKSRVFYARWTDRDNGQVTRRSIRLFRTQPHPTRADLVDWRRKAAQMAAVYRTDMPDDQLDPDPSDKPGRYKLQAAAGAYRAWLDTFPTGGADARLRTIQHLVDWHVKQFGVEVGGYLDRLKPKRLREYLALRGQNIRASTLRTETSYIKSWFAWCIERGWLRNNPVDYVYLPKRPAPSPVVIDTALVRRILEDHADQPLRRGMFVLLAAAGMRQGAAKRLPRDAVDYDERLLRIPGTLTKTGKGRTVPLGSNALTMLNEVPQLPARTYLIEPRRGPLLGSVVNRWLYRYKHPDADKRSVTPHDFRRWYYTTLLELGCPDSWTRALVGHALDRTAAAYTGIRMESLRPWAEKVDALLVAEPLAVG